MSIIVLLEAKVKPESVNEMKLALKGLFPETRTYNGCRGIDAYFNEDDPDNLIFIEHWDSREHHQKYLAWRTETGVMDQFGSMLAGPPSIRYFERVDAWDNLIDKSMFHRMVENLFDFVG